MMAITAFVPGGVIRKGERLRNAFPRILKDEAGLTGISPQLGWSVCTSIPMIVTVSQNRDTVRIMLCQATQSESYFR